MQISALKSPLLLLLLDSAPPPRTLAVERGRVDTSESSMVVAASRNWCPPLPPPPTPPPTIPCTDRYGGNQIRTSDDQASDGDGTRPSVPGTGGCRGGTARTCCRHFLSPPPPSSAAVIVIVRQRSEGP